MDVELLVRYRRSVFLKYKVMIWIRARKAAVVATFEERVLAASMRELEDWVRALMIALLHEGAVARLEEVFA